MAHMSCTDEQESGFSFSARREVVCNQKSCDYEQADVIIVEMKTEQEGTYYRECKSDPKSV